MGAWGGPARRSIGPAREGRECYHLAGLDSPNAPHRLVLMLVAGSRNVVVWAAPVLSFPGTPARLQEPFILRIHLQRQTGGPNQISNPSGGGGKAVD